MAEIAECGCPIEYGPGPQDVRVLHAPVCRANLVSELRRPHHPEFLLSSEGEVLLAYAADVVEQAEERQDEQVAQLSRMAENVKQAQMGREAALRHVRELEQEIEHLRDPFTWKATWHRCTDEGGFDPIVLQHGNFIEISHGQGQVIIERDTSGLNRDKLRGERARLERERRLNQDWRKLPPDSPGYKYGAYIIERLAEVDRLLRLP